MRVCSKPGCPTIYDSNDSRCTTHQRIARASRTDNSVYSSKGHRTFRTSVLNTDPICVECGNAQATVADHHPLTRRELVDAGLNPNDPQHGRGLCAVCHNKHTAHTSPGGWNDRD
jgi:5-methylcytosine-specific restriction protein A